MRKLLYLLILVSTPALAADYYFDSSVSNYSTCSIGVPCTDFPGTTLDNAAALSPGDTLNAKRGKEWSGNQANWIIDSAGTALNFITLQAYGTGANPKFAGGPITATIPTNSSGSVWRYAGQDFTSVRAITSADDQGLMRWDGLNNNLPAGTYCWTVSASAGTSCTSDTTSGATNLYVRMYDSGTPASHGGLRISTILLSTFSPLVGTADNARGTYVRFRDLDITNSPARGFTAYYDNNELLNVRTFGSKLDGLVPNDNCDGCWFYYPVANYNATNGGGTGQGITISSSNNGVVGTGGARDEAAYNGQAGIDFLDYGANNVTQFVLLRTTTHENGISPNAGSSSDPNIYFDAASEGFAYGNKSYDAGKSLAAVAGVERFSVQFGSEHPTTDPVENIQFINNYIASAHAHSFYMLNTPQGTGTLPNNITLAYNTMVSNPDTATDRVMFIRDVGAAADNLVMRNNIFMGNSGDWINGIVGYMATSALDADNNVYYIRGQASSSTEIFDTFAGAGIPYTLASWRTETNEDASSVYGDPLFDNETTRDFHLGVGSSAIDIGQTAPYTIYSWVPQEIKDDIVDYGIKGSTVAAGTEDNYATLPDAGFHYDYAGLVNVSALPQSSVVGSVGTHIISFKIPQYLGAFLYNGKLKVTLPTGWSWNSGGTTTVSTSTVSGTWTFASVGQVGTFTRVGDGSSEFYGTYSVTATQVQVGVSTDSALVELTDSSSTTIMKGGSVSDIGPHFSGFGFQGIGFRIT